MTVLVEGEMFLNRDMRDGSEEGEGLLMADQG